MQQAHYFRDINYYMLNKINGRLEVHPPKYATECVSRKDTCYDVQLLTSNTSKAGPYSQSQSHPSFGWVNLNLGRQKIWQM